MGDRDRRSRSPDCTRSKHTRSRSRSPDRPKGKPVPGAGVSGVRAVTKRQPRQYMNRRGGFNRPLPLEQNR
ncbi:U4/U6.U5 small nuclear ribonucleoprotein [Salix suchowensis]|nr:U4/U6.U5 small nuclear ribonucleoprotein [Salix suchowensis]